MYQCAGTCLRLYMTPTNWNQNMLHTFQYLLLKWRDVEREEKIANDYYIGNQYTKILNKNCHSHVQRYIRCRLLLSIAIILSMENVMLPICWADPTKALIPEVWGDTDACPGEWIRTTECWLDRFLNAERRDLTADICIIAELSNSFTDRIDLQISNHNKYEKRQKKRFITDLRIQRRQDVEICILTRAVPCKPWNHRRDFLSMQKGVITKGNRHNGNYK